MLRYVTILLTFLSIQGLSQPATMDNYRANIVSIGKGQFGFIVGSKVAGGINTYYFVTAEDKASSPMRLPDVYFYQATVPVEAVLVEQFEFGSNTLFLYAASTTRTVNWERYSYSSSDSPPSGHLYTYIEDRRNRGLWYPNSNGFKFNLRLQEGVQQMIVAKDQVFFRGMPVISSGGEVHGIIAQSQEEGQWIFPTITMIQIEKRLLAYSECNYFQMYRYGLHTTQCDAAKPIETKIETAPEETVRKMASGMGIGFFYSGTGGAAAGFSVGYHFHFGADNGRARFSVKPRYTHITSAAPRDMIYDVSSLSPNIPPYTTTGVRLKSFEVPFTLSIVTRRRISGQTVVAFGYAPAYALPVKLKYSLDDAVTIKSHLINNYTGLRHRFLLEFGWEEETVRMLFFFLYQYTPWHQTPTVKIGDLTIRDPFAGMGPRYYSVGITAELRRKGSWGMKKGR